MKEKQDPNNVDLNEANAKSKGLIIVMTNLIG